MPILYTQRIIDKVSNLTATTNLRVFHLFSEKKNLSCSISQGSRIFHCLYYTEPKKKRLQVPTNCLELAGLAGKLERIKSSLSNCTLMTSQAAGLSPAPSVTRGSPENIHIPEISPQSLGIIYLTCLKWSFECYQIKGPGSQNLSARIIFKFLAAVFNQELQRVPACRNIRDNWSFLPGNFRTIIIVRKWVRGHHSCPVMLCYLTFTWFPWTVKQGLHLT